MKVRLSECVVLSVCNNRAARLVFVVHCLWWITPRIALDWRRELQHGNDMWHTLVPASVSKCVLGAQEESQFCQPLVVRARLPDPNRTWVVDVRLLVWWRVHVVIWIYNVPTSAQ